MFRRILVANRGEIACRILRTVRGMGIAGVAVYSDADARAPHVALADAAVRIGPAPAAESYLAADRIIAAARESGAEAIHPGYGFLSESADFAAACEAAGIVFIGPPASAIAAMGDKIASKRIAAAAGVSIVPGHDGALADADEAAEAAARIGYPVMLKASAGGGGKGMRVVADPAALPAAFDAVRREAAGAFGDDRIMIEKYVTAPRHIEIQLLGDRHGHLVHLGERECSLQRRHQKVVEEAPSPFVTPALRESMAAQAIALARAVGYHGAGTVEFVVSGDDPVPYFLEMNTRLQVEHPVTEAITGIDLVEQTIRIAAGEPLAFAQADVRFDGWAVESRIYAEDAYRGFLPATGRIVRFDPPAGARLDAGVTAGSEVTRHYDPMIAKLVTHAATRAAAFEAQAAALDAFVIDGVATNVDFLAALVRHRAVRAGGLTTGLIADAYPRGLPAAPPSPALARALAGLAATIACATAGRAREAGDGGDPPFDWTVTIDRVAYRVDLSSLSETIAVDDLPLSISHDYVHGASLLQATIDGENWAVKVAREGTRLTLTAHGYRVVARPLPAHVAAIAARLPVPAPTPAHAIVAPMPGVLRAIHVVAGDTVEPGQPVATIEAMKMEQAICAETAGTVAAILVAVGDDVRADQPLLTLDA